MISAMGKFSRLPPLIQLFLLPRRDINVHPFFGHLSHPYFSSTNRMVYNPSIRDKERANSMLVYEYKLDGNKKQYAAIEEAIRVVQFIRNTCLRLWMDGNNVSKNDLQTYC